jgi:hypothetical protein
MPRTGPSIITGYKNTGAGMSYLTNKNFLSPSMSVNAGYPDLSPIRALIAETMTRIVRRDPNTNDVLGGIAKGRGLLRDATKNLDPSKLEKY